MTDLRAFARDFGNCTIRVPGHCNLTPTCLCHVREAGAGGMAKKPADLVGVIGCDTCHSIIDGRVRIRGMTKNDVRVITFHAMIRTLMIYDHHFTLEKRTNGLPDSQ